MNKTIISILLLALVAAQNAVFDKHLKEQNFLNYSKRNGKRYANLEESLYRFSVYKDNLSKIEELNKKNPTAQFAENKFSDLTQEEFLAQYGSGFKSSTQNNTDRKLEAEHEVRNLGSYPPTLDLRSQAGMQPIRNQGNCGSCWAFAAVSVMEYAYWKKTGYAGDLSEQQLVDCVYTYGGCLGGKAEKVYDYVSKLPGIAWEWDYKYEAKNGNCRADQVKNKMSVWLNQTKPFQRVANDDDSIKSALANVGVLSVCVDLTGWAYYKSGIYYDSYYEDQKNALWCNHAVNIVGYGTDNGIPYYLVRNSWDTWWGENGYMRMDARRHPNGNTFSGMNVDYIHYVYIY